MMLIGALLLWSYSLQVARAEYGMASYDATNFLCSSFDEFCGTVLDGLGCTAQTSQGCPRYPSVSNDVSGFVGDCNCADQDLTLSVGNDVTKQIMKNRVGDDVYWLLEPWASGPPYTYSESFSSVCTLLLDRLGCPSGSQIIDSTSFMCGCGTLQAASSEYVKEAITARLNNFNINTQYPVFARPVYFSLPLSIAMILVCGKIFAIIAVYLSLPAIVGFICAGVMLQNYLDPAFLLVGSTEIKKTALLIVLMRAGLSIKVKEVHRTRMESSVLGTVPYLFEFFAFMFIGPMNLVGDVFSGWSLTEMGLLAAVMAPLGPSVVITQALQAIAQKGRKIGFVPKVSLISAPLEAVLAIFMFDVFRNLIEEAEDNKRTPWVAVQPLWATLVLIPVNILFSVVMGVLVGFIVSRYIDWRKQLRTDFLWVRLNRNLQMGSNTADLVFVLLVSCYTTMALCVPRYIQQSTGILAVFTVCITLKFFVKDISIVSDIAEGLRAIWIFAEVFLCTLLGATFAFIHESGPLTGQRGLSGDDIGAVAVLMLLGTLCRLLGVIISVCVIMYPSLPPHRQQFPFLWRYCLSSYLMQLPRSTIQASLGPLVLSEHMIPGLDGQNKAFVVSQSGAFTVFVFAPLGALLSKHFALHLTKAMTLLDEENYYNHSKFRYYTPSTLKQTRSRTPSQVEMIGRAGSPRSSPAKAPASQPSKLRRRSHSNPSPLRRSLSTGSNTSSKVQELSLDAAQWLEENHANASKVLRRERCGSDGGGGSRSSKSSRPTSSAVNTPKHRHRTISKSISFSTEGKPIPAAAGDDLKTSAGDNRGPAISSEIAEGGGVIGREDGGIISPHVSKDASSSPHIKATDDEADTETEADRALDTPSSLSVSELSASIARLKKSSSEITMVGSSPPALGPILRRQASHDSTHSDVRFAEFAEVSPYRGVEEGQDEESGSVNDSDSDSDSEYAFDAGVDRQAYNPRNRVPGDSDTVSESSDSEGDSSDEGPIDGEKGEEVDYNELFRQSRLVEMTTLFDTMMSIRRAGRGLQVDAPDGGGSTPSLQRGHSSPAGTFSVSPTLSRINSSPNPNHRGVIESPTSAQTEAGGRRRSQTLQQRLFGASRGIFGRVPMDADGGVSEISDTTRDGRLSEPPRDRGHYTAT